MSRRKWSRQNVIAAIQDRHKRGLSLSSAWRDDKSLYYAAWQLFGGWPEALATAGFPSTQKRWNKEEVITCLQAWHRRGVPTHRIGTVDRRLCSAAYHYFGTMKAAAQAAGIPHSTSWQWTRERVLDQLRAWHADGRRIRSLWRERQGLAAAMLRCFGSQDAALEAAGIEEGRRWTEKRVINRLRRFKQAPTGAHVGSALTSAAYRLFGSWNKALQAAGLTPRRTVRLPRRRWTRQIVLREIQKLRRQNAPLTKSANSRLSHAAARFFGSWTRALATAGIHRPPRRSWTRTSVLAELRRLHAEGHFDASSRIADRQLFEAAERLFGRWSKALSKAGVLPPGRNRIRTKQWTRQRVIEAIQDLYVRRMPLTFSANKRLYAAALSRFGGWHAALAEAGVPKAARPLRLRGRKKHRRSHVRGSRIP